MDTTIAIIKTEDVFAAMRSLYETINDVAMAKTASTTNGNIWQSPARFAFRLMTTFFLQIRLGHKTRIIYAFQSNLSSRMNWRCGGGLAICRMNRRWLDEFSPNPIFHPIKSSPPATGLNQGNRKPATGFGTGAWVIPDFSWQRPKRGSGLRRYENTTFEFCAVVLFRSVWLCDQQKG